MQKWGRSPRRRLPQRLRISHLSLQFFLLQQQQQQMKLTFLVFGHLDEIWKITKMGRANLEGKGWNTHSPVWEMMLNGSPRQSVWLSASPHFIFSLTSARAMQIAKKQQRKEKLHAERAFSFDKACFSIIRRKETFELLEFIKNYLYFYSILKFYHQWIFLQLFSIRYFSSSTKSTRKESIVRTLYNFEREYSRIG